MGEYSDPMVIEASDFQKIKRITSDGKVGNMIHVKMQGNNYIKFSCETKDLYTSKVKFGELITKEDVDEAEEVPGVYQANFYNSMFNLLVKLPGLCSQMQFFSPSIQGYPLKIQVSTGNIGVLQIYLKDIDQLNLEEEKQKYEKPEHWSSTKNI